MRTGPTNILPARKTDNGAPLPVPSSSPDYLVDTRVCDNPECGCPEIHLYVHDALPAGETGFVRGERRATIVYDTEQHEVVDRGGEGDEGARWLREHITDELRARLRERWTRQRACVEDVAWRAFEWDSYRPGEKIPHVALYPHDWDVVVRDGERYYLVLDHYCPSPRCDCQDVSIDFVRIDEGRAEDVGNLEISLDQHRRPKRVEGGSAVLHLWRRTLETSLDRNELRERMADVKHAYALAEAEGLVPTVRPVVRESRKIGRNERCPCGSGRKYKRCCLRREDGPAATAAG